MNSHRVCRERVAGYSTDSSPRFSVSERGAGTCWTSVALNRCVAREMVKMISYDVVSTCSNLVSGWGTVAFALC